MKRFVAIALVVSLSSAAFAQIRSSVALDGDGLINVNHGRTGGVLWDQSTLDTSANALVDQAFGDFPTYASYMATDVSIPSPGWDITGVSTYFTIGFGAWPANATATLHISEIDGSNGTLPPNSTDPSTGGDYGATGVPVTLTDIGGGVREVRWDGAAITVPAGEYAIGLSPEIDFGTSGQEFHYGSPIVGNDTPWRNPGGSFGFGGDWTNAYVIDTSGVWQGGLDGSILINGKVVPEPASLGLLAVGALALIRRR